MIHTTLSVWNPSQGIDLGFIMIRYYSLMFVISFSLGWYLLKKVFEREGEPLEKLDSLFVYSVFATLIGARLGHVFFYDWQYFQNHPLEILLPFQFEPEFKFTGFAGLASHGAAIAIIGTLYYHSVKIMKRPVLWTLDRATLPAACSGIFIRLGNFFNSEIVGKETTSKFGIQFLQDFYTERQAIYYTRIKSGKEAFNALATDPKYSDLLAKVPFKHPAQLYESVGYFFVFFILLFMYWKTDARNKQGLLFGTFLVLLWSIRFIVEFVKESQGGFEESWGLFSTGQWLSIPLILAGFYFIYRSYNKQTI
ncbi:MAG: prolipoprotein diacylglyceryl transferase [Flavobacteriales bacterium]|nr:prolipoprotein diacylglyceryl transferase [Flavobacteriales bacterium]